MSNMRESAVNIRAYRDGDFLRVRRIMWHGLKEPWISALRKTWTQAPIMARLVLFVSTSAAFESLMNCLLFVCLYEIVLYAHIFFIYFDYR